MSIYKIPLWQVHFLMVISFFFPAMSVERGGASRHSSLSNTNAAVNDELDYVHPPIKKARKATSNVWNYMNQIVDEKGAKYAECHRCLARLTHGGNAGTTYLRKHVANCFPEAFPAEASHPPVVRSPRCDRYDSTLIRRKWAIAVIKHRYAFNMATHAYLEDIMKTLNSKFEFPSPNTVRADVLAVFEDEKIKAYAFFANVTSKVSFTTDLWKAEHSGDHYLSLTAHYINDS